MENDSVLKMIINNTINIFVKNCNQDFGNFEP